MSHAHDPTAEDPFDGADPFDGSGPSDSAGSTGGRERRTAADVEVEREHTKRALIEAITRLVVVILYMVFTLVRERDAGVVPLDPLDGDDLGPEDDWAEA